MFELKNQIDKIPLTNGELHKFFLLLSSINNRTTSKTPEFRPRHLTNETKPANSGITISANKTQIS